MLTTGRYGPFLYNPHDIYIGRAIELYGEAHELELDFLRSLCGEGAYVFDVGANIGSHAVPLAQHVGTRGRVFAFEPQRVPFQILCGNVALNELTNVETYNAALGAQPGIVLIPEIDYTHPANYGSIEVSRFTEGRPVPVRTLDEFADLPRLDLVKIDVEGMEREVLAGSTHAIERFRPLLYVENDRDDRSEALVAFLRLLHYRMFWHLPPLFNPQNFRAHAENVFGPVVAFNMLCVPGEAKLDITGFSEIERPDDRPFSLGIAFYQSGLLEAAGASLARAVERDPGDRRAAYNLGVVEDELGRACVDAGEYQKAESFFQAAAQRVPDRADPLANLTFLYHALGRLDEAIAAGNAAIEREPRHAQSHVNLALSYLLAGDYERGFAEYEWRPQEARLKALRRWNGKSARGKRLLISREQGLGDFILLSRFFPSIAQRNAVVCVETPELLRDLFAGFPGIGEMLSDAGNLAKYAAYLPLASIPGVLGLKASAVPPPIAPTVSPQHVAEFERLFSTFGSARKIGIAWAGSPEHKRDRHRSCALADFGVLAGLENTAWISLQKGAPEAQAANPPNGMRLLRLDDRIQSLADTAAAIASLDLVISVDTSVAHLAGAMGKPVWLLNGFGNYWLWGLRQATTPWYPAMRLFHQAKPDDWASLFGEVLAALR